jgi:site-specific DNA-cytosine methylase
MDSAEVTGQSRQRDFIVGGYQVSRQGIRECLYEFDSGTRGSPPGLGTQQVVSALTTKLKRYDSSDSFILEGDRLRILDGDERTTFAGFPQGWTDGFSESTRARMTGNSAVPAIAAALGRAIMAYEKAR